MPKKPDQSVIDAAKKNLDSREVLQAVINDCPALAQALLDKGLVKEHQQERRQHAVHRRCG